MTIFTVSLYSSLIWKTQKNKHIKKSWALEIVLPVGRVFSRQDYGEGEKYDYLMQFQAFILKLEIPSFHTKLPFPSIFMPFCFKSPPPLSPPQKNCQNKFAQFPAFMLLELHAKNQESSINWFVIKLKKTYFGALSAQNTCCCYFMQKD